MAHSTRDSRNDNETVSVATAFTYEIKTLTSICNVNPLIESKILIHTRQVLAELL